MSCELTTPCQLSKTVPPAQAHVLTVPNWLPATSTQLTALPRADRLRDRDRERVRWAAVQDSIPHAAGRRRVAVHLVLGPRIRVHAPETRIAAILDPWSTVAYSWAPVSPGASWPLLPARAGPATWCGSPWKTCPTLSAMVADSKPKTMPAGKADGRRDGSVALAR
jgi:hypothetical protein